MEKNIFDYDGLPVAWYKTGSGKPLIILHGWGSSSAVMNIVAKNLKDIRTCYLIDFPGFGNSPEPKRGWSLNEYGKFVREFTESEINSIPVDCLAHSFGCRVLLKMLADPGTSSLFDKILITGGAGLKPNRSLKFYFKKYTAKLLKAPFFILPEALKKRGLERLRKTRVWQALGSSDYSKLSGVMRETFVKSVTEYQDGLLSKIEHEVLLIWGENDDATPLRQGERLEKGLKNSALVVLENAGHYSFLDQPAKFASIAKAFFNPTNVNGE